MTTVQVELPDALSQRAQATGQLTQQALLAKRGPTYKLQHQIEQIATLPRAKQQVVMQMLDGLLAAEAYA